MNIHPIADRGGYMIVGGVFMAFGCFAAAVGGSWTLGLIELNGKNQASTGKDFALIVFGTVIGVICGYVGWRCLWQLPYQIRIEHDGTIEIVRVLRRHRIAACDIWAIEKRIALVSLNEDDARELRIRHSRGSIPISYFAGVEEFITDVRALNPRVAIEGRW